METLANLEAFVRSAEEGSFSAAARKLQLTPAAVSRNVAQLERNLGARLFQRTTRGLALSAVGERFLESVQGSLGNLQDAIVQARDNAGQPAGILKLTAPPSFGMDYLLPLMPAFLRRYPAVIPDWVFETRPLDFIAGGFDVAIGGGYTPPPSVVARELCRIELIAVASPAFLRDRQVPRHPSELAQVPGVLMRSTHISRVRTRILRNAQGDECAVEQPPAMFVNDPDAQCRATVAGMGVGLVAVPHALPHLNTGALQWLLPDWHCDLGPIALYYGGQTLLPGKTRAFVDFVRDAFQETPLPSLASLRGAR
ncbi:HTH-type transcriptional regulator DmlR [Xanthomonas hydrangeae]|nr:HTH-type transcriptional regulator DmlR [Xanthomonas hydrangeae]CAD7721946.1 HTH-type transcriptional regulator DmlR [Xanthomonas hydrangeae]CAD7728349.1 HTH-type transcriptional regulator DmlR [Xanthomonas hydrangeae]CAD7728353.1 HTH-type transcriptional regulator DmlR [Xanthomonas hydrangeae]